MNMGNKGNKAQSAMEYLMTYGWAILIIAVVLAVLFSLNVFNAGANLGIFLHRNNLDTRAPHHL